MKSKILIIYTGGTIGMIRDPKSGELKAFNFEHLYEHVPELERLNVQLNTVGFDQPIDSSEMQPKHWSWLVQLIDSNYDHYDGFVILHGSDTMAFTASALSFLLDGLKKPVILTGSQLPIGTIRTDGKENLITAIEIASAKLQGESIVQEVAVYFEYSLYRGNRSSKISANQFEAFASPNFRELAVAGVEIDYRMDLMWRSKNSKNFLTELDSHVGLIRIFPGLNYGSYASFFDTEKFRVIILETYGSGNAPSNETLQSLIEEYIQRGGIVINVTQCASGAVQQGKYETSSFFNKAGVLSAGDMTTEATLTKAMYLLNTTKNNSEFAQEFSRNLRGELTE